MDERRRTFLITLGTVGTAALAGCGGAGDDGNEPATEPAPGGTSRSPKGDEPTTTLPTATITPSRSPTQRAAGTPVEAPATTSADTPVETSASSSTATRSSQIVATDGDGRDLFGISVALSEDGTTALVGASQDEDPNGSAAGSASVFTQSGGVWTQDAKLAATDGDASDLFGISVALSDDGTTALVGAEMDEDPNGNAAGSAYVFTHSGGTWGQQAKLVPTDGDANDFFGGSVALSDDGATALVGAPKDDEPNGTNAGSAYVFTYSGGWSQQAKLAPSDGDSEDLFGSSVALGDGGRTAIVGSPYDESANGFYAGSASVFTRRNGEWTRQNKLAPSDGDSNDNFGASVAVSDDGTTALVGSNSDEDPNGDRSGSAYVFTYSGGWSQQAKLAPSDGDSEDLFGCSVALADDGTTALAGAKGDEHPAGGGTGSAYVFTQSGGAWTQQVKLVPTDGDRNDLFGESVALSGNGARSFVGDPNRDDFSGTVCVFE